MKPKLRNSLVAIVIAAALAGGGAFVFKAIKGYRLILTRQSAILAQQEAAADLFLKSSMVLEGYKQVPDGAAERPPDEPHLYFVGHAYPMNGYRSANKPDFLNREEPLEFLAGLAARDAPVRFVFGGDNVYMPTDSALDHLAQLKATFPQARFLLGNHESYWADLRGKPDVFGSLFKERYWHEDVEGVRLVYLHTVTESGLYGLDPSQKVFLKSILQDDGYRFALVFMHHAPWAGDSPYVNRDYASADSLKNDWAEDVLPLLASGRVKAVFAGDGGVRRPGRRFDLGGIRHYLTGWTRHRSDIPPEWLSVSFGEDGPAVTWNKLLDGRHYVAEDGGGS